MSKSKWNQRLVGVAAALALSAGFGATGAAPATAAGTVWDRVAQCESSGNWKINTGNGYYGGLQFSSATWRGYGGGAYASTANRATKAEQIAIARRTLAGQGPGAWPVCGPRAGLTKASGNANSRARPAGQSSTANESNRRVSRHQKVNRSSGFSRQASKSAARVIHVKSGDTLSELASRHHVRGGWQGLWSLNKKTVRNPNWIYVGQILKVTR